MKAENARPPLGSRGERAGRAWLAQVSHASACPVNPLADGALVRLRDGRVVGRVVGDLDGRLVYTRRVDRERHQLRRPPAWAVDCTVVEGLQRAGVAAVRLIEADGTVWVAPLAVLVDRGFQIDRNHGVQVALPLRHWRRLDPAQPVLPEFEE